MILQDLCPGNEKAYPNYCNCLPFGILRFLVSVSYDNFFYGIPPGRRAYVLPVSKRLMPPMDTRNTEGITSALPGDEVLDSVFSLTL